MQPMRTRTLPSLALAIALVLCLLSPAIASAQIVVVTTPLGVFRMQLHPQEAPITTLNFRRYIGDGDYTDSFIHRSAFLFDSGVDVIQGGGYTIDQQGNKTPVPADPAILNEPGASNLRGTVAMARGAGVNSATSQWYINLSNSNASLDNVNGGFTVFAHVLNGLSVADAIHDLDRVNIGGAFTQLPILAGAEPPTVEYNEVVLTSYRIMGDFDSDGDIDDADFGFAFSNFTGPGGTGQGQFTGDFDGDRDIDDADFGILFSWFTGPMPPLGGAATVPEPASVTLLLIGSALIARRRR